MSEDPSLWAQAGLRVPELTAGAAGGIVYSALFRLVAPIAILTNITVGALMANYLTESAVKMLGTSERLTGFGLGLAGMAVAQAFYNRVVGIAANFGKAPSTTKEASDGPASKLP